MSGAADPKGRERSHRVTQMGDDHAIWSSTWITRT